MWLWLDRGDVAVTFTYICSRSLSAVLDTTQKSDSRKFRFSIILLKGDELQSLISTSEGVPGYHEKNWSKMSKLGRKRGSVVLGQAIMTSSTLYLA